jgi:HAD superfamily phosphatase (TIGR01668 family)
MIFYPSAEADSVDAIPFDRLYKKGYRGIIFDIDNTLVPHGAPADVHAISFFMKLRKWGYDTCLISNNKEPRVLPFAKAVNSKAVWDAHKPAKRNYLYACETMHLKPEQVLFVGDQLFTDVWGANRAGIKSILVKPIHPKEEIQIVLKRYLERIVLFFYHKKKDKGDLLA